MPKRYASIWFRYLTTDWQTVRQPGLKGVPFVFAVSEHGRMVVAAVNQVAELQGITVGMVVADARACIPHLQVLPLQPGLAGRLVKKLGLWCIRYTPVVAADLPDGLILDVSGCTHLWGGERAYLTAITGRLGQSGYQVCAAIADTVGAAWAAARFGPDMVVEPGMQRSMLAALPPAALRLPPGALQRLFKLGLCTIGSLMDIPAAEMRRRFGNELPVRLKQALGEETEYLSPLVPIEPYVVRLPCPEPIRTATGIGLAIQQLLDMLCERLGREGKGARQLTLTGYRVDGKRVQLVIGTGRATANRSHLANLCLLKIPRLEPGLGIELFMLEAARIETVLPEQEVLWSGSPALEGAGLAELLDRLAGKNTCRAVNRYLPGEHYWPERAIRRATTCSETAAAAWQTGKPRPTRLLPRPEPVEASAPIPDYPPMVFRYRGEVHQVIRADGPERIAREWWLEGGEHRDYYYVEDEQGRRYWLFRSGFYNGNSPQRWFIHGFFA